MALITRSRVIGDPSGLERRCEALCHRQPP
jgi:hypothetical protein